MSPSPVFAAAPPPSMAAHIELEKQQLANYQAPDVQVADRTLPGTQGRIPVRIFTPNKPTRGLRPIFVWFHGGAFVFGNLEMGESQFVGYEIASRADAVVISVDYRLVTDESRFPICQIDGFDAVSWVYANAESLGADPDRLFVGGASAGGCLTGSVALQLRDAAIDVAGFIPIYPLAHSVLPSHGADVLAKISDVFHFSHDWAREHNAWLTEGLAALGAAGAKRYCFPGDATDKTGQAPFLIINADKDSLRTDGEAWAKELRSAGVRVTDYTEPRTVHGYLSFDPASNFGTDHTLKMMANFIRE